MIQYNNQISFSNIRIFLPGITVLVIFFCWSCKNEASKEYLQLFGKQKIILLDSTQAAAAITTDEMEYFFEKVTPVDMSIQLKRAYAPDTPRDSILLDYQQFLKAEVSNFTEADRYLLNRIVDTIRTWCVQLSPTIFPNTLRLIKTKGNAYGNGVYFTRENCIIIPADVLETPNETALREVLIHEVFHIYSRLNPKKRLALYSLIGFEKLHGALILPNAIQSRLLLNPDGIDMGYGIRLEQMPGDTLQAVPIITANAPSYLPERKNYFNYINFNLYPVEKQLDELFLVDATPEGISPLHVNDQRDFFKQITDNTLYIIHPDEIMADNFQFLVAAQSGKAEYRLSRFSREGQALLNRMAQVLKE